MVDASPSQLKALIVKPRTHPPSRNMVRRKSLNEAENVLEDFITAGGMRIVKPSAVE